MRIDRIVIGNFKNLNDLEVDFAEDSLYTVLLGRNGAGKSNVLEAIVIIFRNLFLGLRPAFRYFIAYTCKSAYVTIDADPNRNPGHTRVTVDGIRDSYTALTKGKDRPYLPQYVFGYYSGPSNRLEKHFEVHQERFRQALRTTTPNETKLPLRPMFYTRSVQSQFVLLSYFLEDHSFLAEGFLEKYLRIRGLESVLFAFKRPHWMRKEDRTDRFWGAKGVVRSFLDDLYAISLAPLRLQENPTHEVLYLYVKDLDTLRLLFEKYGRAGDFFKALESTYISELLQDVRIRVNVGENADDLTFSELSEGEQQLLTVLGLLRFTREEESLFLLDEPDTHLNPAWSLQYLSLVKEVVRDEQNSHVIITSHDPLMIGGLLKSQVQIVDREATTGRITARQPNEDPKGMGVAALLTSDIFGLRSTVDPETLEKLEKQRELAIKDDLTRDESNLLEELGSELGSLDFTRAVRDPLYQQFVTAMVSTGQYQQLKAPVLTADEMRDQRELALKIVQEITSKEIK